MNIVAGLQALKQKYASRGLLIDTNVLLLYFVGLYDETYITEFKRTIKYTRQDYHLVRDLAAAFHRLIITPHILSELSNLSLQIKGRRITAYFARVVEVLQAAKEIQVPKEPLLADECLPQFGFTDLSIAEAARHEECLVLTDEWALSSTLDAKGCAVINFNHLRGMQWST